MCSSDIEVPPTPQREAVQRENPDCRGDSRVNGQVIEYIAERIGNIQKRREAVN